MMGIRVDRGLFTGVLLVVILLVMTPTTTVCRPSRTSQDMSSETDVNQINNVLKTMWYSQLNEWKRKNLQDNDKMTQIQGKLEQLSGMLGLTERNPQSKQPTIQERLDHSDSKEEEVIQGEDDRLNSLLTRLELSSNSRLPRPATPALQHSPRTVDDYTSNYQRQEAINVMDVLRQMDSDNKKSQYEDSSRHMPRPPQSYDSFIHPPQNMDHQQNRAEKSLRTIQRLRSILNNLEDESSIRQEIKHDQHFLDQLRRAKTVAALNKSYKGHVSEENVDDNVAGDDQSSEEEAVYPGLESTIPEASPASLEEQLLSIKTTVQDEEAPERPAQGELAQGDAFAFATIGDPDSNTGDSVEMTSRHADNVTVWVHTSSDRVNRTLVIPAGGVLKVQLSSGNRVTGDKEDKAIYISCASPITVSLVLAAETEPDTPAQTTSNMSSEIMPIPSLGQQYSYLVTSQVPVQFVVVATEDDTEVQILGSDETELFSSSINNGQTLHVNSENLDLGGEIHILTSKPVSVTASSQQGFKQLSPQQKVQARSCRKYMTCG